MYCRRLPVVLLAVAFVPFRAVLCADEECARYHEIRVAYLLGCCGDVPIGYPGPPFPGKLNAHQRATRAIEEAARARKVCVTKESPEYLSVTLDMAGAYLMRGAARSHAERRADSLQRGAEDAASAKQILLAFTREHPSESFQVWRWIATALSQAGSPGEALEFLSRLPPQYAEEGEVHRVKGDLLFVLDDHDAAAGAYSEWLSAPNVDQCAVESFATVAKLEILGFRVPRYQRSENIICQLQSFQYYIRLRTAHGRGKRKASGTCEEINRKSTRMRSWNNVGALHCRHEHKRPGYTTSFSCGESAPDGHADD